jgi:hypothetical protein
MSDEIFFDGRVYVSTQGAARTTVVTALKKYAKRNHCSDAKIVSAALELIGGTHRQGLGQEPNRFSGIVVAEG